jgi:hypothetical protein
VIKFTNLSARKKVSPMMGSSGPKRSHEDVRQLLNLALRFVQLLTNSIVPMILFVQYCTGRGCTVYSLDTVMRIAMRRRGTVADFFDQHTGTCGRPVRAQD